MNSFYSNRSIDKQTNKQIVWTDCVLTIVSTVSISSSVVAVAAIAIASSYTIGCITKRRTYSNSWRLKNCKIFIQFSTSAIILLKYCGFADSATLRSSSAWICAAWLCFAWDCSGVVGLMTALLQIATKHKTKNTNCNEQKQTHYKLVAQNHNSIEYKYFTLARILP